VGAVQHRLAQAHGTTSLRRSTQLERPRAYVPRCGKRNGRSVELKRNKADSDTHAYEVQVGVTVQLLRGDCRETLPTLGPASVQACITSPPYYGLRDYGLPALVWGGDAEHIHEWCEVLTMNRQPGVSVNSTLNNSPAKRNEIERPVPLRTSQCSCSAWLGSLGLEPSADLYIDHIVECFRHVRRVLRADGVLWLNLGDSYAGSGKGPTGWNGIGNQERRQGFAGGPDLRAKRSERPREGVKPKDLLMMPFRVAMALQADGWWLRSVIPWLKRNSMPESVQDRPATSVEYVFLLAKSRTYYWNGDVVRVTHDPASVERSRYDRKNDKTNKGEPTGRDRTDGGLIHAAGLNALPYTLSAGGRNRRNSDWFFESWQGLMLDEQDDPLALVVNPQPFTGAHFATFPARLVEPMIKASTRSGDTVLDPFFGAGTVGLVADRLGRSAIGCELSESYSDMGADRITGDAPLFAEVVA
jgi:DNA modification methylase